MAAFWVRMRYHTHIETKELLFQRYVNTYKKIFRYLSIYVDTDTVLSAGTTYLGVT